MRIIIPENRDSLENSALEHKTLQKKLYKQISEIEDLTEPSSLDIVLDYADRIQEEDEEFMRVVTEKLQNAKIYWEQPWYQKVTALGRRHSLDEAQTTSYRTDYICKDEKELIAKNWRKLVKRHGIPDKIVSFARWKNEGNTNPKSCAQERARRYIVSFLARNLERDTHQIFRHVRTYYGCYVKGKYTDIEEKIIEICYYHKVKSAGRLLCLVLGREPRAIHLKLQYYCKGKPQTKRLKWTLTLATKFLRCLLKHSELQLEELRNKKFDKCIWQKLEEDMDQNVIFLQHFWYCYLHVQIFARCDVKLHKLKKTIFKKIKTKVDANVYKIWSDIRWKDIASEFSDAFTPRFLYKVCHMWIRSMKRYLRLPLERVVEFAFQKIKRLKNKRKNKRLKTLRLNEKGQLELVNYKV